MRSVGRCHLELARGRRSTLLVRICTLGTSLHTGHELHCGHKRRTAPVWQVCRSLRGFIASHARVAEFGPEHPFVQAPSRPSTHASKGRALQLGRFHCHALATIHQDVTLPPGHAACTSRSTGYLPDIHLDLAPRALCLQSADFRESRRSLITAPAALKSLTHFRSFLRS